jgi:tetratricopeptide (TPR) repeat protein
MIKKNIILTFILFTTFNFCYSQSTYYGYQERNVESQVNYSKIAEDLNKSTQIILINRYYENANRNIELKDYNSAIIDYTNVIKLDPKDASAYYYRGIANYYLQYNRNACLDWIKAGQLGNGHAYELIRNYCN